MNMYVKNATLTDIDQINHLLRLSKAYWGYDAAFMDRFMKKLGISESYMQKNTIKLFYIEGQLAGFYNFLINDEGIFELDNFFLHPKFIGKGLGRQLWEICCKDAAFLGKNEFIIWSDPNTENFYLKMGCEKIGIRQSPMMPNRYPPVLKYKLTT